MAKRTNCTINGKAYYRITRTIGRKYNENGVEVPVRKPFYGESKKDAESKYQNYMKKRSMGIEGKRQYFGILADRWLYDFLAKDSTLKDRSKELYIGQWNTYVKPSDFYVLPLDQISASTIQTFYNELDCPASAVKAIDKVMKKFYRYLEFEGYTRNITGYLVLPKSQKPLTKDGNKVVVWSDDEISKILNGFDKAQKGFRLRFLLILAYNTGCRISELLALTYDDFEDNTMSVNKQVINRPTFKQGEKTTYKMDIDTLKSPSSYRVIPLNHEVITELEKHRTWQKMDMLKRLSHLQTYLRNEPVPQRRSYPDSLFSY